MAYLHCGRCGLQLKLKSDCLRVDNCPRCLARGATVAPMTLSPRAITHAVGWGSHASDPHRDPPGPGERLRAPVIEIDRARSQTSCR